VPESDCTPAPPAAAVGTAVATEAATSETASPVLELGQLLVRYPGAAATTLDGLDLRLNAGERLALVGPSGCGKSTVARAVLQLLPAGSQCGGELRLLGRDPRRLSRGALRQLRGEAVGLVFQAAAPAGGGAAGAGRHRGGALRQLSP